VFQRANCATCSIYREIAIVDLVALIGEITYKHACKVAQSKGTTFVASDGLTQYRILCKGENRLKHKWTASTGLTVLAGM